MTKSKKDNLLARLTGRQPNGGEGNPWAEVAARSPSDTKPPRQRDTDEKLEGLLERVNQIASQKGDQSTSEKQPATAQGVVQAPAGPSKSKGCSVGSQKHAATDLLEPQNPPPDEFIPREPQSLRETGLTETEVEALILKFLQNHGNASGHVVAEQTRLPFRLVEPLLHQLKQDRLVAHRGAATLNDYVYQCTDLGRERAMRYAEHCTYFGAAPVSLKDYIESIAAQSIERQRPTPDDLRRAFADLVISDKMFGRLGPAVNSGRGLFLYGAPGNGKTSIAERVTRAFGEAIWIPRAIGIDGEIIRVFDPANHEELPLPKNEGLVETVKVDKRWVRIRRPTIVVGGELTMENLEVAMNTSTGISEAPMQMKSNCGTLVIDDFGRQRMSTDELLNRWIVPLEKRYDFLNLANGKKIQVPFDQLIVFSTNLEPRELCDDAFLRRIPYKIEVTDPDEPTFRKLLKLFSPKMGVAYDEEAVEYLIERHYRAANRPFRCCQPRDLLMQVRNHCRFQGTEAVMSPENFDFACENYFAVM